MNLKVILTIIVAAAVILGLTSAFTVDETEQVIITRFSRVTRDNPGSRPEVQMAHHRKRHRLP